MRALVRNLLALSAALVSCLSWAQTPNVQVSECGQQYGCLLNPAGCTPGTNCVSLATYKAKGNDSVEITLMSTLPSSTSNINYIALGFSRDKFMGEDSVTACLSTQPARILLYYNPSKSNVQVQDLALQGDMITMASGGIEGNTLWCKFVQKVKPVVPSNEVLDLTQPLYLFLAKGTASPTHDLSPHVLDRGNKDFPFISAQPVTVFQQFAASGAPEPVSEPRPEPNGVSEPKPHDEPTVGTTKSATTSPEPNSVAEQGAHAEHGAHAEEGAHAEHTHPAITCSSGVVMEGKGVVGAASCHAHTACSIMMDKGDMTRAVMGCDRDVCPKMGMCTVTDRKKICCCIDKDNCTSAWASQIFTLKFKEEIVVSPQQKSIAEPHGRSSALSDPVRLVIFGVAAVFLSSLATSLRMI